MDDRIINIFLEDGQKREYLVNSKHTVERIKAVVAKDHEPTFGSTAAPPAAQVHAAGDYTLSVVTFYSDRGEFTMRDLEREKDKILLYILFPDENPSRQSTRRSRSSKRVAAAAAAAAASQRPSKIRYELLYHRSGVPVDLGERKFVGMFVPRSTHRKADLINHLTVRIANPDKTGNLRKFSEKRKKWEKKYFMLKNGILWYVAGAGRRELFRRKCWVFTNRIGCRFIMRRECCGNFRYCASREDQTDRKSISLVGVDPIAMSTKCVLLC